MECLYVPALDISTHEILLDGAELHHLHVLRCRPGENIYVVNGKGLRARCILSAISRVEARLVVIAHEFFPGELPSRLTVGIGIPANRERLEWLVEKCVELGVTQIVLVSLDRCQRSALVRVDRLKAKMIAALKQAQRSVLPTLDYADNMEEFLLYVKDSFLVICDAQGNSPALPIGDTAIMIGPEGGFSEREYSLLTTIGVRMWRLAPFRLRTETAVVTAVSVVVHKWLSQVPAQ